MFVISRINKAFFTIGLLLAFESSTLQAATFTISALSGNHAIPNLVYGGNEDYGPNGSTVNSTGVSGSHDTIPNATYMRLGGNRLSSYNWENNADNAGADYGPYNSDFMLLTWVGLPGNASQAPAAGVTTRYDQWRSLGKEVLATVQMMGWAAADGAGVLTVAPPDAHWKQVLPMKGTALSLTPNTTDNYVYMDEYVNFLVHKYGTAANGGIKYYDLDNEPGAWRDTHNLPHSAQTSYAEELYKCTATAKAILNVDGSAQIIGPSLWSYSDIRTLSSWTSGSITGQDAPDAAVDNALVDSGSGAAYGWFMNYFLRKMQAESASYGKRLLHYFDFHYYPEAKGSDGNRIIYGNQANSTTQPCAEARMQAPRSLWDSSYVENSWYTNNGSGAAFQLIPRLNSNIATYYPGTQLSVSEYYFGADWDISGGIAQADMLGVLGRFQVAGNYWQLDSSSYSTEAYTRAAFNLYLNYDGTGGKVGDTYIQSDTDDWANTSVYASRSSNGSGKIWVVALCKNYSTAQSLTANLSLGTGQSISSIKSYRFGVSSATLATATAPAHTSTSFTDTLPARSATLYEVTLNQAFITPSASMTPTLSATSTPSMTASPSPSATPTFTRSPSPTGTATASATPSSTPGQSTATLSASATATRTASPSGTASLTQSESPTMTGTGSPSRTMTASASPSPTSTATLSGTVTGTMTLSPTASPTSTLSAASATLSPSSSASPSQAPSFTLSITATLTALSSSSATPTQSHTASLALTSSPSSTLTPPATPTLSSTPSVTASASASPTGTWTAESTLTPSQSFSPSFSTSVSVVSSATSTPTRTRTTTLSATPSLTGTQSRSATPTLSQTFIPASVDATLFKVVVVPNPCAGGQVILAVQSKGAADGLELRAYSKAWVQVFDAKVTSPLHAGWNSVSCSLHALPQGLSYLKVRAFAKGGQVGNWVLVKVMVLR